MSKVKLIVLFIISFILFLVTLIPVSLVASKLSLPKNVAYQGMSGNIWQGEIQSLQANKMLFENIHWKFEFSSLLHGNLGFDVKFGNPRESQQLSGRGIVSTGLTGHQLRDFVFRMPADDIRPFLPLPLNPIAGRFITTIDIFQSGTPVCEQLSGEFIWSKSGVNMNGPIPLGTIASTLLCDDNKLAIKFDGDNLLGIDGTVFVESGTRYNIDVFVKPDASLPAAIHQGVGMLGKMDNKGKYKIKL
ncbi:type II secretion system protein N [uncultured Psychrosphaera sp.]|uniref:type II secretion system protein N n=1 Tax=uncultured Psychrosphaera sp. TaxID=1403522 RepID=UPI00262789F5|nr:type II secretion system protein N [uncultured Psychrosphaera sp.]